MKVVNQNSKLWWKKNCLESLKKKLSSATGISIKKLSLVVRGESISGFPPETKITEFWSSEDVVAIFSEEKEDALICNEVKCPEKVTYREG